MSKFTVVYDACVLYPAPLRDTLMRLALTDLFKAHWTDRIHEEWVRACCRFVRQPRCCPKFCQTRRVTPVVALLQPSHTTQTDGILGATLRAGAIFPQYSVVARSALSCEKMASGAASHETATGPNALLRQGKFTRQRLERVRDLMDAHATDAKITGYEPLIGMLELPDPDDRHVLAAAIRCNADAIVTFNRKDFPEEALKPYEIDVLHPDDFIYYQVAMSPVVIDAQKTHSSCSSYPRKRVSILMLQAPDGTGFPLSRE